jgi:hypothetical protein
MAIANPCRTSKQNSIHWLLAAPYHKQISSAKADGQNSKKVISTLG